MNMLGAITEEQRLQKGVVAVFGDSRYRSAAGILLVGERSVSDTIATACTNGRDEWYSREMIKNLTDAQLR